MVLMALVNSNYEFIFVDVGKNGRFSDWGVIEHTKFYQKLRNETLNLPENDNHVLKPYPGSNTSHVERIFNYRLS